jgi:similar to stage IV sporulation protein
LETETKSNIKAARSGQITEINTKSGTKECKIGDAVIKGQVLISGICEDILGGLRICHAEGEVIADTQYTVDISVPYNIKRTVLSKEYYEKNDVEILGVKIPVYFYYPEEKDFLTAQSNCAYCFSDTKIPVILKNTRLYPAKEECLTISEEQAKQTATMILQLKKLFCFSDKEIKDVKLKYIKDAKKLNLCAEINCSEDIGEQHELLLDENLRLSPDDPNEEAPQNNTDSG